MTQAEKLKYWRSSIAAAALAAGIGAFVKDKKAKKDRKKALDVASSKNAIVVPIVKSKFLEGIQTPEEHRKAHGGATSGQKALEYKTSPVKALESAPEAVDLNDPASVAALKKDILKARKFDFFGKRASVKKAQPDDKDKEKAPKEEPKEEPKAVSEEKIDGRVVLRGQDGKFVSPTDPIAVQEVEKDAFELDKWWQPLTSPVELLSDAWNAAKGKPVAFTAGAVGSIALAAKISDAINEIRREKAKRRAEDSRKKYVKLLESGEGNEKVAETDHSNTPGAWIGGLSGAAFLVPMALTAIVANKVIENRRAEKKKEKEMADSYPQDPIILYQTYDGENLKIAADTALMAIMVKRAMIEDAERAESLEKRAQIMPGQTRDSGTLITPEKNNLDDEVNFAVKHMTDPKNRKDLLRFIQAQQAGDESAMESAYRSMMPFGTAFGGHYGVAATPEFKRALASNKALQDAVVGNLENDSDWKAYRDSQMSDRIAGWGLDKGGILHKIIMWLANTLGFGNSMAKKYVMSGFDSARDKYQSQIDKMEAEKAQAAMAKEEEARKAHFAPLENFKGTEQERQKLENDLNDSWMIKQVNGINDPDAFAAMAENLGRLHPGSPQYKALYDALSKKKDLNLEAFGSLPKPVAQQGEQTPPAAPKAQPTAPAGGAGQPAAQVPSPQNAQTQANAPQQPSAASPSVRVPSLAEYNAQIAKLEDEGALVRPSAPAPYQGKDSNGPVSSSANTDPQQYQGSEAPDYAAPQASVQQAAPSAQSTVTHSVHLPYREKAPSGMRYIPNLGYMTDQEYQNNLSGAPKTTTVGQASDFAPDFKNPDGSPDIQGMVDYLQNGGDEQNSQGIPSLAKNTFTR